VAATKKAPRAARATPSPRKKAARKPAGEGAKAEAALRAYALTLPGAVEEFPWGDRVMKVNKKVFVFMGTHEGGLAMSTKLPDTAAIALTLPFASPTRYGLGKSGWVTALFAKNERPPLDMMRAWIEESYRAIAPAKLVATLDG
jgi:predicted DNA-binding protein (MmcQ/YjbR family)